MDGPKNLSAIRSKRIPSLAVAVASTVIATHTGTQEENGRVSFFIREGKMFVAKVSGFGINHVKDWARSANPTLRLTGVLYRYTFQAFHNSGLIK